MNLYNNKYRIPSARHKDWNYANEGAYFITICTKDRINYFGDINEGNMLLNEMGRIATSEWLNTAIIRKDMNVTLGEFIVMPNHFHAIIHIGANEYNMHLLSTNFVETPCMASLPTNKNIEKFGAQRKNLASIIRGFKSAVTKYARIHAISFEWQARYHDHIIRDANSFDKIEQYIINNPLTWQDDVHFML